MFGWLAPWLISVMKDMAKTTVIKSKQNTIKLKNHLSYSPGSSVYNSIVSCGFQCDKWTQLLSNKIQLVLLNNGDSRAFIHLLHLSHHDEVCQTTNLCIQHSFYHGNVYTSSPHGTNLWPRLPWTSVLVKSICTRIPLSTHTHTPPRALVGPTKLTHWSLNINRASFRTIFWINFVLRYAMYLITTSLSFVPMGPIDWGELVEIIIWRRTGK